LDSLKAVPDVSSVVTPLSSSRRRRRALPSELGTSIASQSPGLSQRTCEGCLPRTAPMGVEPFQPAAWVGHSDLKRVMRYYRLGADASRAAMERAPFGDTPAPEAFSVAER